MVLNKELCVNAFECYDLITAWVKDRGTSRQSVEFDVR